MMLRFFQIFILVNLLFVASCSKDNSNLLIGKEIKFKSDKIEVNQNSFNETSQLDNQIRNKIWIQKGGDQFHSLSNIVFKFPLKKKWTFDSDQEVSDELPILTEMIAYDEKLYVLNAHGYLYCIDNKKGTLVWKLKVFNTNETS